jgi:hypothetical protein
VVRFWPLRRSHSGRRFCALLWRVFLGHAALITNLRSMAVTLESSTPVAPHTAHAIRGALDVEKTAAAPVE